MSRFHINIVNLLTAQSYIDLMTWQTPNVQEPGKKKKFPEIIAA